MNCLIEWEKKMCITTVIFLDDGQSDQGGRAENFLKAGTP